MVECLEYFYVQLMFVINQEIGVVEVYDGYELFIVIVVKLVGVDVVDDVCFIVGVGQFFVKCYFLLVGVVCCVDDQVVFDWFLVVGEVYIIVVVVVVE